MKKLDEIGPPERNGEDGDCDAWEKDLLIDRLTAEGHRVISVGRALVTVEQCDPEDPFPRGWGTDPLRLTIYPDPDAGFGDTPQRYIDRMAQLSAARWYRDSGSD